MPIDDDHAYWRQYYGIGQPWAGTRRNRTGCLVVLVAAMALVAIILVAGLVVVLV